MSENVVAKMNGEAKMNGHKLRKFLSYDRDLDPEEPEPEKVVTLTRAYRDVLHGIKEDPTRQGLLKTPERAAKAFLFFTKGYEQTLQGKIPFLLFQLFSESLFCFR
ncbi:GTP cyclohydrolase 1 [Trichonephila inaurata madagascariensis]|uniref:GTP cyclohydrolase 1 n=1 Tax=Trichonephila inaurata madagascariensis TaxID=2747483 RepID=A0A8X6WNG9_9ARAC|nr:GTP cyclohydrolase 1 [Trichonephila inaurata madagascariensis]